MVCVGVCGFVLKTFYSKKNMFGCLQFHLVRVCLFLFVLFDDLIRCVEFFVRDCFSEPGMGWYTAMKQSISGVTLIHGHGDVNGDGPIKPHVENVSTA